MTMIFDFSHLTHPALRIATNAELYDGEDFVEIFRNVIFDKIFFMLKKYHRNGEQVILATDSGNNWRKHFFPEYKVRRDLRKQKEEIDWKRYYEEHNKLIEDLKQNFQFTIVGVDRCEGDDIIGVLIKYLQDQTDRIVLVAIDKDFKQLHQLDIDLIQVDSKNKPVLCEDGKRYLLTQVLTGDSDDDVPNVFCPDNYWTDYDGPKYRFGKKTAEKVIDGNEKAIAKWGQLEEIKKTKNFQRNYKMISFNGIPKKLQEKIIQKYLSYKINGTVKTIIKYLYDHVTDSNHLYANYDVFELGLNDIQEYKKMGVWFNEYKNN